MTNKINKSMKHDGIMNIYEHESNFNWIEYMNKKGLTKGNTKFNAAWLKHNK